MGYGDETKSVSGLCPVAGLSLCRRLNSAKADGAVDGAVEGAVEGHSATPASRVNAAGTHLLSLINEILDLSKIEAGKLELNPERVDLARLIDESSAPRNSLPRRTTTASSSRRTKTSARSPRTPCGSSRFCSIS